MPDNERKNMVKVYRYGLLSPTWNGERVTEQISLAHRYQNALIEIRLDIQKRVAEVMECEAIARAKTALASAYKAKQPKPEVNRLKKALKDTVEARKSEKATELTALYTDLNKRTKMARSATAVYWGTYLMRERAVDAAAKGGEMHFRRWTGEGSIGVQLQHGLTIMDCTACDDTRLQLDLALQPVPNRGGKPLPRIRLRIGSEAGKASPIWAEFPIIYHRPLPADAIIKWAQATRRIVAGSEQWHLCLTLSLPEVTPGKTLHPAVAVDLGWRREINDAGEETTRAGGWTDDGETAHDVLIDPAVPSMLSKTSDLQSIRDKRLNEFVPWLLNWREHATLPAANAEKVRLMGTWKSQNRLAGLWRWWKDNRIDGDAEMFARLSEWRKKDKHLWGWQENGRQKALARRREQYRVLARQLANTHDVLVIEKLSLDKMAKDVDPDPGAQQASRQRFATAPSELRAALLNAFKGDGKTVLQTKPGPLAEVWRQYREGLGEAEVTAPARVNRFQRRAAATDAQAPKPDDAQMPETDSLSQTESNAHALQ